MLAILADWLPHIIFKLVYSGILSGLSELRGLSELSEVFEKLLYLGDICEKKVYTITIAFILKNKSVYRFII